MQYHVFHYISCYIVEICITFRTVQSKSLLHISAQCTVVEVNRVQYNRIQNRWIVWFRWLQARHKNTQNSSVLYVHTIGQKDFEKNVVEIFQVVPNCCKTSISNFTCLCCLSFRMTSANFTCYLFFKVKIKRNSKNKTKLFVASYIIFYNITKEWTQFFIFLCLLFLIPEMDKIVVFSLIQFIYFSLCSPLYRFKSFPLLTGRGGVTQVFKIINRLTDFYK